VTEDGKKTTKSDAFSNDNFGDRIVKGANGSKVLVRRAMFFVGTVQKFKPEYWKEIITQADAYTVDDQATWKLVWLIHI
jgi:hypothetical protein